MKAEKLQQHDNYKRAKELFVEMEQYPPKEYKAKIRSGAAALQYLYSSPDTEDNNLFVMHVAFLLANYYESNNQWVEGDAVLVDTLTVIRARAQTDGARLGICSLNTMRAAHFRQVGLLKESRRLLLRNIHMYRTLDNSQVYHAGALKDLARLALMRGDLTDAKRLSQESLHMLDTAPSDVNEAWQYRLQVGVCVHT
jgi:hypothetical protein